MVAVPMATSSTSAALLRRQVQGAPRQEAQGYGREAHRDIVSAYSLALEIDYDR